MDSNSRFGFWNRRTTAGRYENRHRYRRQEVQKWYCRFESIPLRQAVFEFAISLQRLRKSGELPASLRSSGAGEDLFLRVPQIFAEFSQGKIET